MLTAAATVLTSAGAMYGMVVFFAFMTLLMIGATVAQWRVLVALSRWPDLWSWDPARRCVVLTPPREMVWWEVGLSLAITVLAPPVAVVVFSLQPLDSSIAVGGLGALGMYTGAETFSHLRHGRPRPQEVALTRRGMELTHVNGQTLLLPWGHRPRLTGVQRSHVLLTARGQDHRFSHVYLPIGMRQLDRLLATYQPARNRTLLDQPQALAHVLATLQPTPDELADTPWMWQHTPQPPSPPLPDAPAPRSPRPQGREWIPWLPPDRTDQRRRRGGPVRAALALAASVAAVLALRAAMPGTAALLAVTSLVLVSLALARWRLVAALSRWRSLWHWDERRRCVVMTPPREMAWWEACLPATITVLALLMSVLMRTVQEPGASLVVNALGALSLYTGAETLARLGPGLPRPQEVALTRKGMELTHVNGQTHLLPWDHEPQLVGVRLGLALLATRGQEHGLPVSHLPLSMRQLDRLITTYRRPRNRAPLDQPREALTHVLATLEPTPDELSDTPWMWRNNCTAPSAT